MDTNLRDIFNSHRKETKCDSYYCTTCGGISHKVKKLLNDVTVVELLENFESLSLNEKDFNQRKQVGFPKDKQCSNYILFIKNIIDHLDFEKRINIITKWSETPNIEAYAIDGVGFYLITDDCSDIWIPLMKKLSSSVPSIKETLNLRFGELS